MTFVRTLIAEREASGPFTSLYDFFYRAAGRDFNRKTAECLIRAGALDGFGYNRRELLGGFEALMDKVEERRRYEGVGQLGFFGEASHTEEELPRRADFSPEEKLRMEREMTGLYISGHPLEQYDALAEKLGAARIGEVLSEDDPRYPEGGQVVLLGMVAAKKEKVSKNGARMAFVDFEDETGQLELIVFPQTFQRSGALLRPEQALVVVGKITCREDEDRKLVADWILRPEEAASGGLPKTRPSGGQRAQYGTASGSAQTPYAPQGGSPPQTQAAPGGYAGQGAAPAPGYPSGNAPQAASQPRTGRSGLFLRVSSRDGEDYRRAVNLLEIFDGSEPVYIRFRDTGKLMEAPRALWTAVCPVQLSELRRVLGDENVVYRA